MYYEVTFDAELKNGKTRYFNRVIGSCLNNWSNYKIEIQDTKKTFHYIEILEIFI